MTFLIYSILQSGPDWLLLLYYRHSRNNPQLMHSMSFPRSVQS
jgi:hypothetical protein